MHSNNASFMIQDGIKKQSHSEFTAIFFPILLIDSIPKQLYKD